MDVVVLFTNWMGDANPPDFSDIRRRLHESFNVNELRNLEVTAQTLLNLIDAELALRGSDSEYKHPDDPEH